MDSKLNTTISVQMAVVLIHLAIDHQKTNAEKKDSKQRSIAHLGVGLNPRL